MDNRLIDIKELCAWLGVSKPTARNFGLEAGARRVIGGSVRYDVDIIKAALVDSELDDAGRGGRKWPKQ